jgi:hypothetical protein
MQWEGDYDMYRPRYFLTVFLAVFISLCTGLIASASMSYSASRIRQSVFPPAPLSAATPSASLVAFDPAAISSVGIAGGSAATVVVSGTLAFIGRGSALDILDTSDTTQPALLASLHLPGFVWALQVVGNRAYVANGEAGLQIVDVSDSSAPALRGSYNTPGEAFGVQVVGTLAYIPIAMAASRSST